METENLINKKIQEKYYSLDPANVSMLGKITNFEEEEKPFDFCGLKFERDNSKLKVYRDLKNKERILIFKEEELWVIISTIYYDMAVKIIEEWKSTPDVFVQDSKDSPVLIASDDFGMVIAPRIMREEDEQE